MTSGAGKTDIKDRVQIGLSIEGKALLGEMEEQGLIGALLDGYRLAIALAISEDLDPSPESSPDRENMYNMATIDPNGEIRLLIRELYPQAAEWPNRAAESLAEQGIPLIERHAEGGVYWLGTMGATDAPAEADSAPADAS